MILPITKYGHPVLRQKGAKVGPITADVQRLVADMLETMRAASGVGLAAQQVGHALQLTVIDIRGIEDRPSTMDVAGKEVDPAQHMPLVLLDPEISPEGDPVTGPEGCLSFPEMYADITRPASVRVRARTERGEWFEFGCGGLLARAVQHEYDHLQGILFIDRMDSSTRQQLKPELEALQRETKEELRKSGR
jgi:peptide deformylase